RAVHPAHARGSDRARCNVRRARETMPAAQPNLSLADFIAPRGTLGANRTDYLGAFAATAGLGAEDLARTFERDHDDYSAIVVKALADRLAEAPAADPPPRAPHESRTHGQPS